MSSGKDKGLSMIDAAALAVCLGLSAAIYFVAVEPVLREQAERRQQETQLSERESRAHELETTLTDRRRTLQQTEQQVASRSLTLVPLSRLNQRLSDVTQLADACDLHLDHIEPGEQVAGTHYMTVPIHLAGRGKYASATAFLEQMHTAWPDLAVASVDLRGNPRQRRDEPQFALQLLWFAAP